MAENQQAQAPPYRLVPANQGIPFEEIQVMLGMGWIYAGRLAVASKTVLTASQFAAGMSPGVQDIDLWLRPQPTLSFDLLASALLNVFSAYPDAEAALNMISEPVLGLKIADLASQVQSAVENAGLQEKTV